MKAKLIPGNVQSRILLIPESEEDQTILQEFVRETGRQNRCAFRGFDYMSPVVELLMTGVGRSD